VTVAHETVPPSALAETVERVILFAPDGSTREILAGQLRALELGNLAIAWIDESGKVHRCAGLPMEVISVENRIVKPV